MKKIVFIIMLAVILVGSLLAQALSVDSRKVPIQMADNFDSITIECSADTLYNRVLVPSYATEAWMVSVTGGVDVCKDSLYTRIAKDTVNGLPPRLRYARIAAGTPFTLPLKTHTKFYVRRAAAGTATTVYIIWRKL